jgi:elongation factor 1-beta
MLSGDELFTSLSYALMSPGGAASSALKAAPAPAKAAKPADDDDELDLFGDDEEEEDAAAKAKKERAVKAAAAKAAYDAKKAAEKPKTFRSLVVLEVKPWEADTDLEAVWKMICQYKQEGLVWGESFKLEPVAFGVKKLVMSCVIDDDKVLMDDITDNIEAMEDHVQSVQVCSMNKL